MSKRTLVLLVFRSCLPLFIPLNYAPGSGNFHFVAPSPNPLYPMFSPLCVPVLLLLASCVARLSSVLAASLALGEFSGLYFAGLHTVYVFLLQFFHSPGSQVCRSYAMLIVALPFFFCSLRTLTTDYRLDILG